MILPRTESFTPPASPTRSRGILCILRERERWILCTAYLPSMPLVQAVNFSVDIEKAASDLWIRFYKADMLLPFHRTSAARPCGGNECLTPCRQLRGFPLRKAVRHRGPGRGVLYIDKTDIEVYLDRTARLPSASEDMDSAIGRALLAVFGSYEAVHVSRCSPRMWKIEVKPSAAFCGLASASWRSVASFANSSTAPAACAASATGRGNVEYHMLEDYGGLGQPPSRPVIINRAILWSGWPLYCHHHPTLRRRIMTFMSRAASDFGSPRCGGISIQ